MASGFSESRFLALKEQLDQLHYSQPLCKSPLTLAKDSAPLCEKLLWEVIRTTEGFQNLKRQNDVLNREKVLAEQAIVPVTKENERIVRESNDLHREIMEIKESQ